MTQTNPAHIYSQHS